ncbi:phosphoglycerate mutase family protein [Caballeronia fortuita]|uniref:Phosphoglycerate mutase family protein n=1 Tax=Caballeronia fortuita TaxID=1777138 RepID=A0A158BX52_9BURK|nr:histidine phosphatase family protein [Caballeronia fortuita]SAK74699.1 phosphoglycerate mutase family protein [Caballeronia fortuita]
MDLVLIRHPRVAVDAGVCYGQTDVPLRDDAHGLASALSARMNALNVPACVDGWHASPLARCASIAQALGGVAHIDARLAEMNFGAWEGRAWDLIDRALIDAWADDIQHARPHGGESLAQFAQRVIAWFDETCGDRPAVHVVAHAGVVRVLAAHLLGIARESALQWPLEFGGIVWFRRVRDQWVVVRWNV